MIKPTPQEVEENTLDTRSTPLEHDGRPRRIERREVFGHLTGDYRVAEMFPATMDDALSGRASHMDPKDNESPLVVWKPICQWARLSELQSQEHLNAMVDPDRSFN